MKNEGNIDFRATTTNHRSSSGVEMIWRLEGVCNTPLQSHNIINMNGRIYDPITAQFMQADNFVQTPEDYIGYNRYSYCRHNPFKYTDPSGEQYQAGSGGGGVMAAVGAAIIAAEEQAQNAMAMALGDAMRNWNPRTRIGEADAARARAERSFGGASGGSASDGGFFGKVIKAVGSIFSNIFKKSAPASATGTSTSQQQGTGAGGTGVIANCDPVQNSNYDGIEQEKGPRCGFQVIADICRAFGIKVTEEDVRIKYEKVTGDINWEANGGGKSKLLVDTAVALGLKSIEITDKNASSFKNVLDMKEHPIIMVGLEWNNLSNGAKGDHFLAVYGYEQENCQLSGFMYYDTLNDYGWTMPNLNSKTKLLYNNNINYTDVYGVGFYK